MAYARVRALAKVIFESIGKKNDIYFFVLSPIYISTKPETKERKYKGMPNLPAEIENKGVCCIDKCGRKYITVICLKSILFMDKEEENIYKKKKLKKKKAKNGDQQHRRYKTDIRFLNYTLYVSSPPL